MHNHRLEEEEEETSHCALFAVTPSLPAVHTVLCRRRAARAVAAAAAEAARLERAREDGLSESALGRMEANARSWAQWRTAPLGPSPLGPSPSCAGGPQPPLPTPPATAAAPAPDTASVPHPALRTARPSFACRICARGFATADGLHKHVTLSALHLANVAKQRGSSGKTEAPE
jgi:hypothetical protein